MADPTGRTFLFSIVNAHDRVVKLRLKADHRDKALNFSGSGFGPGFGDGADLLLMWDEVADEPGGCYTQPESFELDEDSERAAGLPPVPFSYDETLLAGVGDECDGRSRAYFAAAEIEVYQL